jgi:putative MFS transporter
MDENVEKSTNVNYRLMDLFSKQLWKRTAFGGLFYVCQVVPYFAIYTFLPTILDKMGFKETFSIDMYLNLFLLLGSIAGLWCTEKLSRRGFTIYSFIILTVSLFVLSLLPANSHGFAIMVFVIFTFVMSAASNLTLVYPAELFPTEIRGSGVGVVTAISRVGSAIGTFLLPVSVESLGMTSSMIAMAIILLIGTVVSIAWAPETKSLSLTEASNPHLDELEPIDEGISSVSVRN